MAYIITTVISLKSPNDYRQMIIGVRHIFLNFLSILFSFTNVGMIEEFSLLLTNSKKLKAFVVCVRIYISSFYKQNIFGGI